MKDRIKQLMESLHLSQKVFAQQTGISEATLSGILNDKSSPSLKIVERIIARFPQISVAWLIFGKEPMLSLPAASTEGSNSLSADKSPQNPLGAIEPLLLGLGEEGTSASPFPTASTPLFSQENQKSNLNGKENSGVDSSPSFDNGEKTIIKYIDKPARKITEIRVFYDDQTWETFVPSEKV